MPKLILFLFFLVGLYSFTSGQTKGNLKGKVVDSLTSENLEFATVAVLNQRDSSLISYTTTLKSGEFNLHNLPSGIPVKLVISFVGYNNYRRVLTLDKGATVDAGIIKLAPRANKLGEVTVRGEATPIIVKKDTIEFSAEAFKTPPNAVVEELLKRLPGIQVDLDGTITVNGKTVKKLLIDGKQFFTNDPRIATKTLDADLIAKIQVYDDRDDDPDHLVPDAKVEKIINLKLKNAIKKSTGGKLHGGYGTSDRFDAGLLYNMFRDTLQISGILIANNLNRTGFSQGDLTSLGGFNRSGSDALGYNGLATGGRNYGGIQTVGSSGINVNNDYGKRLKINLLYYYSYTKNVFDATSLRQQFFSDTTLSTASSTDYTDIANKHALSGLVEWNPDTIVKVRYQPKLNYSTDDYSSVFNNTSYNNFFPKLNNSYNTGNNNGNSFQFQQSFSYYRKLHKKGESLNITHNLNINPGSGLQYSTYNFTSFTSVLPSSNLDRLANNNSNVADLSLNVIYRYPFTKKLTGDVSFNNGFNRNHGRIFTYNLNPQTGLYSIYIDSLSRNLVRRQFTETVRPELTYKLSKTATLIVNAGLQFMQIYNQFNKNVPDINRTNVYLLPSITFNSEKFSIAYAQNVYQPSINDLLPYFTFSGQLYSSVGNPSLKPERAHNINLNFYTNKSETLFSTNEYANLNYEENSVFYESTVSSQGATVSRPVNKNGTYSFSLGGYVSKGFKKFNNWQIRLSTNISAYTRHSYFQINNQEGFQNTVQGGINQTVTIDWNNKFDINPSYGINPNITTYQNVPYNAVKYVSQNLNVPIVARPFKRTVIEANYAYTYNPLVANGFQKSTNILNLSIARQIQFRDRGEIKLSCYDLFDQNISAYRYASGNSITDQESQILKRYFLLTYAYRFTSTVTKK